MAMFYIKKKDKFLGRSGEPIRYGTPLKFTSFFDAWKWIASHHEESDCRIVRVYEAKERMR